jgi:hypothetical protein
MTQAYLQGLEQDPPKMSETPDLSLTPKIGVPDLQIRTAPEIAQSFPLKNPSIPLISKGAHSLKECLPTILPKRAWDSSLARKTAKQTPQCSYQLLFVTARWSDGLS